ncbi:hypothetical protein [Klebsiella pneumoniae]|uniref:hypothetical protein n=1 Tax=Klebsiella pneumoniae TaxID=573 RepID=UPI00109142C7|nr:hypothetical protein [Klebsiella pneumoniae]
MADPNFQINLTSEDVVKILDSINNRRVASNLTSNTQEQPPEDKPILPACGVIICGNGKAGGEI